MKIKSLILSMFILVSLSMSAQDDEPEFDTPANLLIFSKSAGFRHESISSGIKMLYDLSKNQNWVITATEDASIFNEKSLPQFDVVVFMNPTGDGLTDSQQAAFESFMKNKKGLVAIHSAADFEYEWPYYAEILGAHFKTHPPSQTATVKIENHDHPAMKPFEGMDSYTTYDEWYSFKTNPRSNVHVLASLDESSLKKFDNDNWRMNDHPLIWWQENNGTRSFYTGFGHTHEAFQDEKIIEHIQNAINWAAKRLD